MMGGGYGRGGGFGGPMVAMNLHRRAAGEDLRHPRGPAAQELRHHEQDALGDVQATPHVQRGQRRLESHCREQRKVDDLRCQVLTSRLDMRKQMESVLTPEQRKQGASSARGGHRKTTSKV
jgi:hypothetical protein